MEETVEEIIRKSFDEHDQLTGKEITTTTTTHPSEPIFLEAYVIRDYSRGKTSYEEMQRTCLALSMVQDYDPSSIAQKEELMRGYDKIIESGNVSFWDSTKQKLVKYHPRETRDFLRFGFHGKVKELEYEQNRGIITREEFVEEYKNLKNKKEKLENLVSST